MTKENPQHISLSYEVFNHLDQAVCITGLNMRVIYMNSKFKKMLRRSSSAESIDEIWNLNTNTIKNAEKFPVKLCHISSVADNSLFNLTVNLVSDEGINKALLWLATEELPSAGRSKIKSKNLVDKNDLYHTLFETSPSGILLLNETGVILDVNQSMCASTGHEPAELIGKHVSVLALPENITYIDNHLQRILSGETLKHEVTSRRKDGTYYYSLLVESAVTLPDGKRGILSVANDITERKLAEAEQKEREIWFRAIANYTANWESMFSPQGRIVWTNPAAERFTGFSPDEIIEMPDFIEVLVAKPDREKAREVLMHALVNPEGKDHFFRCIRKDGTYFWLSLAWTHIRDDNGHLIGIRTSGQDVTLRLEALQALRNSENIYRQMVENAPFGMHFFELNEDNELIFTHSNPAADQILNHDHNKYSGLPVEKAFPALKNTDIPHRYKDAAKSNHTWITEQLAMNSASGHGIYEVKAFQTVPGKMAVIFNDITKRIKAEEQLRESRQLFETLARMAPVGIFRTNAEGETTFVNPKWSALCGLSYAEALQNKYISAIHPDDRDERVKEWKHAIKHKLPVISEYRFVRPDGSIIWVQGQAVPEMVDGQVRGYIGTITDITELIETQNDLRTAKEKAEASNSLKTTFMKNLSHEIRTPLNGIFGFAQLLGSGDYSPEENAEFVSFLEHSINRMTKTIDNTMELSLLMTGNMHRNDAMFNLGSLMQEVFKSQKGNAEKKNLILKLNDPGNKQQMVITDRMMVKRIVEEITDNAIKFTDYGMVNINYRLEDNLINIKISDTGQGISTEYLPLIFEPFMQENVYAPRLNHSTGLGLSIVQGLTSLLGGTVKAESEPEKGTIITLSIPVRSNNKTENTIIDQIPQAASPDKEPLILVVEDEMINMLFIKRLLNRYKCTIIEAKSGKEAVTQAKKHPDIDIILMDIRMPGMDGYQAIELIREINPAINIAAVTAYGGASDREACLAAGCIEYLAKPFHSKDLFNMLRRIIQWPPEN